MSDTPKIANDCAICCDEITKDTGRSVMSCGHEFHMRCLVQWLQKPDGTGNCPCCRAEPAATERLVAAPVADDSDDESDDESEEGEETTGVTPFMDAVRDGNFAEMQRMIAEGVNIEDKDSDGDTALVYAVINGEDECVTALIAAGADITAMARHGVDGEDMIADMLGAALLGACVFNSLPCVLAALNKGANPNYAHPVTGLTPLMEAMRGDVDLPIVDALLAKGASVTVVDSDGWNVFMWFAEGSSDIDVMASLLTAAGPMMAPMPGHAAAAKKIQALWRGHTVRSTRRAAAMLMGFRVTRIFEDEPKMNCWFMDRMMAVQ
jgi:hypothetical protein